MTTMQKNSAKAVQLVETKPIIDSSLHPDVDPREQVTSAIMKVMGNPQLVTDADIRALEKALGEEKKRRSAAARAKRPQPGTAVRIVASPSKPMVRWAGKDGTVIASKATRSFVKLGDSVLYVLHGDIEKA
jgi:hypothetical protein